jgi:hypothetical protein
MKGRLVYAIRQHRRRIPTVWLRLAFHDFISHAMLNRGGERCQDCGRDYVLWRAPTELYVELYVEIIGSSTGLYCPVCFDRHARAKGIIIDFVAAVFRRIDKEASNA